LDILGKIVANNSDFYDCIAAEIVPIKMNGADLFATNDPAC
jgi:hypothetical protein